MLQQKKEAAAQQTQNLSPRHRQKQPTPEGRDGKETMLRVIYHWTARTMSELAIGNAEAAPL